MGLRKASFIAQMFLGNLPNSCIGWTPSTFVSSRSDRARQQAARPEDFMDDEDLAELRDNQKLVDTTEQMDLDFWERRKAAGSGDEKESVSFLLCRYALVDSWQLYRGYTGSSPFACSE